MALGSEFTRFFPPIVKALRETGGSGTTSEVIDRSIELLGLTEREQNVELASGSSRVRNQAQWARLYMARGGTLDSSKRGVWRLTEIGNSLDPNTCDRRALFKSVHKAIADERKQREESDETPEDDADDAIAPANDYVTEVLTILRALPHRGLRNFVRISCVSLGFNKSLLRANQAIAELTELVSFRLTHLSVSTYCFNANDMRDLPHPHGLETSAAQWSGVPTRGWSLQLVRSLLRQIAWLAEMAHLP